ncbi:MAG: response regulator transcription factor [Pirellulaceae bacterium]|nr:response regulator transcription factor [Pirellulaceae bacterium]
MTVRILIIDDHEVAREGLAKLLRGPHIDVTSTSSGGDDPLAKIDAEPVDAVLLDVRMPNSDGLSMLAKIHSAKPKLPVIMLSAHDNPTYIARAVALGATDYLLKSDDKTKMTQAVTDAVEGRAASSDSSFKKVEQLMRKETSPDQVPSKVPLTPREIQVMRHVGLGLSNKEIASSLSISVETVKEHVQNILRKLGANDRTDAAVRAVKMGLVN